MTSNYDPIAACVNCNKIDHTVQLLMVDGEKKLLCDDCGVLLGAESVVVDVQPDNEA